MSMNNIPVLRVFDAQGKGIEIPAIKGEKGDLTSTVLLSAGSDSDDYTVRYSDGLQISFGYFAAVIQNTQQIAALGESKTIFLHTLQLPLSMERVFSGDFLSAPAVLLQYCDSTGEAVCLSVEGTATQSSIGNLNGLFLRSSTSSSLTGRIGYYAIGRWK